MMNHHERLQREFLNDFDGRNWHKNSDHLADQVPVFRSLKSANESAHGESVRESVRLAQITKENQTTAKEIGVTHDDIH